MQRRGRVILERLVRHHVAPVARGVPDRSRTGTSRRRASANASSPHGYQSTGLSACWRRYGLVYRRDGSVRHDNHAMSSSLPGRHGHVPVHRHRGVYEAPRRNWAPTTGRSSPTTGGSSARTFALAGGARWTPRATRSSTRSPGAREAVAAAVAGQRALAAHEGRVGHLRVRIGLRTGELAVGDEGYVGLDVRAGSADLLGGARRAGAVSESTRAPRWRPAVRSARARPRRAEAQGRPRRAHLPTRIGRFTNLVPHVAHGEVECQFSERINRTSRAWSRRS